jgi:hypothetical protein
MIVLAGVAAVGVIALKVSRKIYLKSMRVKIPKLDFAKATLRVVMEKIVNQSGVGGPSMALQACSSTAMTPSVECAGAGGCAGF